MMMSETEAQLTSQQPLVEVSIAAIAISILPLAAVAVISKLLGLELESPIVVGTIRTFVQLSLLAVILHPIFVQGVEHWGLVIGYGFLMILLASYEASSRSKYYAEKHQFLMVLGPMSIVVVVVATFAFAIVLQPTPIWGR